MDTEKPSDEIGVGGHFEDYPEEGTDEEFEERSDNAHKALREHWAQSGWVGWSPEEFYVTWPALADYAWKLLRCNLLGHIWHDSHYNLYGSASDSRDCDRCYRREVRRDPAP